METKYKAILIGCTATALLLGVIIGMWVSAYGMIEILNHVRIEQMTIGFNETKMVDYMMEQVPKYINQS